MTASPKTEFDYAHPLKHSRHSHVGVHTAITILVAIAIFALLGAATPANAKTYTICSVDSSETSFNPNYFGFVDPTTGMRAKLTNPSYFGTGGTVAPEDFAFQSITTVSAASLASCNIFIGGGFEEGGTVPAVENFLTPAESAALQTWANLGGERFVVGGCDFELNETCLGFGRNLTQFGSGAGVSLVGALVYNPLTCGGANSVNTFGGQASRITPLAGDITLATHNGGGPGFTGSAAAITDSVTNPKFLMTADADMYGSSGDSTITTSPIASNPQAIFILNVFKFAADAMSGRLANPTCFADYNSVADLELAISTSNASPTLNGQTTVTVEVANTSANPVTGVTAAINLPAGLSFVSQSGTGTFTPGTGTWTIGALGAFQSVTITLTVDANATGANTVTAEITNSSLPDTDSAPNASFAEDDHDDGLNDDDEDSVVITTAAPPTFTCPVDLHQVYSDSGNIGRIDLINNTFVNLPNNIGFAVNGAGYRDADNYVYAVSIGDGGGPTRHLIRIHNDGTHTDLGAITGLPQTPNAGDFGGDDRLYVRAGASNTIFRINVDTVSVESTITLSGQVPGNVPDLAYNPVDGFFYGVNATNNRLYKITPAGVGTNIGPAGLSQPLGAMFGDAAGNIFGAGNNDGNVYQFNLTTGAGTVVGTGTAASTNDGFYCPSATFTPPAVDLSLAKSVDNAAPISGGNTTFTLTVTNNEAAGGNAATNIAITDLLPAELTYVSDNASTNGFNDGGASDDSYASGTGIWTVPTLPANTSVSLQIVATTSGSATIINYAQITAVDQADPNSTANNNAGPTPTEDDEAAVSLTPTGPLVSGTVFNDNGAQGGAATAHDGQVAGTEVGIAGLLVEALDGTSAVISSATTAADGTYTLSLPVASIGNPVTLRITTAGPEWLNISDDSAGASTALPSLVNASAFDGEITFTPAAGTTYTDVDFGQIQQPALTQDQSVSTVPGGIITIPHTYTATTNGNVIFAIAETSEAPDTLIFSEVHIFIDVNGDQILDAGDTLVSGAVTVNESDQVRLIVRTQVSSGAPQGAALAFDVVAFTDFTTAAVDIDPFIVTGSATSCANVAGSLPGGFDPDHCLTNTDTITVSQTATLKIEKTVCNDTAGATSFGLSNIGSPGDVLIYRLRVTNPGTTQANNIEAHDTTPAFTTAFGANPVSQPGTPLNPAPANCPASTSTVPPGITCTTNGPTAGNAGAIDWNCTGPFNPSAQADFYFHVQIDN